MVICEAENWGTREGLPITPRKWQLRELPKVLAHYSQPRPEPGVIFAVTGSGKAILLAQFVASLELEPDEVVVVSTSTILLVRQLADTIRERVEASEYSLSPKVGCYYTFEKTTSTPIIVTCMPSLPELAEILQIKKKRVYWIADEMHRTSNVTAQKAFETLLPVWSLGLSVGPDSYVVIKSTRFGVEHITIGEFVDRLGVENGQMTAITGYETRSFDGKNFCWNRIKAVLKHAANGFGLKVTTEFGRDLIITKDHSVMRLNHDRSGVEATRGDALRVGDYLIADNQLDGETDIECEIPIIDHINGVKGHHWNVVDGKGVPAERGTMRCRCRGNTCATHVPVGAIAYMIGFFIGNGWVDKTKKQATRVGFSMHIKKRERFMRGVNELSEFVQLVPTFKERDKAIEIRFNNKFLADFFLSFTAAATEKRVPGFVFDFDKKAIAALLRGLVDSDGHVNNSSRNRSRLHYSTSSIGLAHDILAILSKIGIIGSLWRRKSKIGGVINGRKIVGTTDAYIVHASMHGILGNISGRRGHRKLPFKWVFGGFPVKIREINECDLGDVYDFSMDEEVGQVFVANGILVHNSATPYLADKSKSLSLFSKVIARYTAKEALADKCVVGFRIIPWTGQDKSSINEACLELTKDAIFPGMYSALDIDDAENFAEYLNAHGISCMPVHSKLSHGENKERMAMLKRGEIKSLVFVSMLSEGVDIQQLRFLCLRAPCGSRVRYVQMLGRVLRYWKDPKTGEEKTEAVIYDPLLLAEVHSLTAEAALGGEFAPDEEEDEGKRVEKQLQADALEMLREIVKAKANKDPIPTSPLAGYLTELINCFDIHGMIQRKISARTWRKLAASQRQLESVSSLSWCLTKKTIPSIHQKALTMLRDNKQALNSGMASDLISIEQALCEKAVKWPDFSQVDRSAAEGLVKHEKHKTVIPPPRNTVKPGPKVQQGMLFETKRTS